MIKKIVGVVLILLVNSCASLPSSSVTLTNEIAKEAANMHQLNISLINKLFEERLKRVDLFFENKYMPTLIKKYEKLIPDSVNYKKELPNIIASIVPVINQKKDSITAILKNQNTKIVNELSDNYTNYQKATNSLQNLIVSVTKVEKLESDVLLSIEKLTGTQKDVTKVKSSIESFLNETSIDLDKIIE